MVSTAVAELLDENDKEAEKLFAEVGKRKKIIIIYPNPIFRKLTSSESVHSTVFSLPRLRLDLCKSSALCKIK
jgi:hypothetical protein